MTAVMKLYEISDARAILDQWLEESEGELTPELEALLAELDGKADEKIERVGLYVRERQAHAKAVKEEADRLNAIVKRETRAADSLKGYLKTQMELLGKTRVNGLLCTVRIQTNGGEPAVTCALSPEELKARYEDTAHPVSQFVREVVSYTLDRASVLDAFGGGGALPDEIHVERGTHVRVQ